MRLKAVFMLGLAVVLVLGGLVIMPQGVDALETDEMRLYLHSNPTNALKTSGDVLTDTLPNGFTSAGNDPEIYSIDFPLTRDLQIEGMADGNGRVLILYLANRISSVTVEDTLDVRFISIPESGAELQIAAGQFQGSDMDTDELKLDLTTPSGMTISEGSTLELRISFEGEFTLTKAFTYGNYNNDFSFLTMVARPIREEDVELSITDQYGNSLEELLPNGPPASRSFNVSIAVNDAFGANDVLEANVLMTSEIGNTVWNATGNPDQTGGEDIAIIDLPHTLPEGTPEGTYDLTVTVTSGTGQTTTIVSSVEVTSGLQVTVDDPERDVDAGETVEVDVSILNGGEATDRVTFSASSSLGWLVESPDPEEITGGSTGTVTFRVFVPIRSDIGDEDEIEISVFSRNSDREYVRDLKIMVISAAVFGVESTSETTKAVVAGGGVQFQIRIVNLQDESSTFEVGMETIPNGWTTSFAGGNGTAQGSSIYQVTIAGDEEADVSMNIMTTSDSEGVNDLKTFVRERGGTDRSYLYFKVRVVDPDRPVLTLLDTTDEKESSKVGSFYPIRYSEVFFNLELYNPSLIGTRVQIDVFEPTGWDIISDESTLDLLPGEFSGWNISITPRDGESYKATPYVIEVEVKGTDLGDHSQDLKVKLKAVRTLELSVDRTSPDAKEGEEIPINVTVVNKGNLEMTLNFDVESPADILVTFEPDSLILSPESEGIVRVKVTATKVSEEKQVKFDLKYSGDGVQGSKEISIFTVKKKEESSSLDPLHVIGAIVALILILAVGYFLFTKFRKPQIKKPARKPAPQRDQFDGVKVTTLPERNNVEKPSGKPKKEPQIFTRADNIADSILSSTDTKRELSSGITVEAEPEVIEAEVVTAEIVE